MNKPTLRMKAANAGYEPGSVMSRMTTAERRAFEAWQKQRDKDASAYERGLGAKDDAFTPR
jgi:hypothetical protein